MGFGVYMPPVIFNVGSSSDSTVNVKVIAEKIKTNFEKVRDEFDGKSALDKDLGLELEFLHGLSCRDDFNSRNFFE